MGFVQQEQLDPNCPDANQVNCNPNPITLFAPTNEAFDSLASQLGTTVAGLLGLPQLTDILLYHLSDPAQVPVPLAASDGDLVRDPPPPAGESSWCLLILKPNSRNTQLENDH